MKQILKSHRGGEIPYAAPEVEVYEITVERGFATSGDPSYDVNEGTEQNGSDYESTGW